MARTASSVVSSNHCPPRLKVFTNDGWLIFEEAYLQSVPTLREVRGNFDTKNQSRWEFVTVFYAFAGFFWGKYDRLPSTFCIV
jgi:hypothetical protein